MKIGELLITQGQLTPEGLEEALDWQVLYGGRLGTNLLELQLVQEEHLARGLGKQLGAEVAWGELAVDPALIESIPQHIALRHEIVPWKLEKRRLKLLCCEIDVAQLDQLSYKMGRTCVPVIAPEHRITQLLRAHYQAVRQMRALDFGVVPEEGRRRKKAGGQGPKDLGPELMDETAFNDIYAQVVGVRGPAAAQAVPAPPQPPQAAAPPAPDRAPAASWQSQPAPVAPPPVMERVAPPEPEPGAVESLPEDAILEELPADAIIGESADTGPTPPLPQVSWDDVPAPAPAPIREMSPLGFQEALRALEGVTDRDEIAHLVLRASRSKAARALLLQVQGGVALGWDGLGEGLDDGAAAHVALPLGVQSAFALVAKTRSHYMGPLQKTPANIRFLAMLGKKVPLSSLIFPILHKGRVSHMLYLDNGHKQQAPTDVGEMLILSQRISQTVEALVERKRKAARG